MSSLYEYEIQTTQCPTEIIMFVAWIIICCVLTLWAAVEWTSSGQAICIGISGTAYHCPVSIFKYFRNIK